MHELGHSLGLGHSSDVHNSIMFPYYKASYSSATSGAGHHLGYDDVMGMYNLYSKWDIPPSSPTRGLQDLSPRVLVEQMRSRNKGLLCKLIDILVCSSCQFSRGRGGE